MQPNAVVYIVLTPKPLVNSTGDENWNTVAQSPTIDAAIDAAMKLKLTKFAIAVMVVLSVHDLQMIAPKANLQA